MEIPFANSATLTARRVRVLQMDNARLALMGTISRVRHVIGATHIVLLVMVAPQHNVADAQKATFWMLRAIVQSRGQTLGGPV
jgi:hypothetical protein